MRRALSFALVMLLVLRGLLGDAMAMGMGMAPVLPAPEMAQLMQAADGSGHGTHDGTHASAAMAQHCCDPLSDSHPAHQAGCSACGVCHSALGVPAWVAAPAAGPGHALQPPRNARFASALAAQAIKPPIV